ncbi:hypothetical protein LTR84_006959 [Exophiala bonariae]|uniref:Ribosome biogenesis protein SLX9 n=1 Tax=Exophiala bonariae TaxID=1690606 RepID=A0AAV9N2Z4_9EURO|nr:hypothetical protein LTR84_006959 [Exophiala bonariae]
MPHKHKRKRENDESNFNLAPNARARTLSVHQKSESIFTSDKQRKEKLAEKHDQRRRKRSKSGKGAEDDTPKAFARLMAFQNEGKRVRSGLDDGLRQEKKKKKNNNKKDNTNNGGNKTQTEESPSTAHATANAATAPSHALPKILPGERLSDFSLRVDQSLPLTGVPKHSTRNTVPGLDIKTPLTKHNKRLARMQRDWRAQEAKIRDREEEAADEDAEKREEEGLLWLGVDVESGVMAGKSGKGKKKRRREVADEGDPWKVLERKRREEERAREREEAEAGVARGGGGFVGQGRTAQSRGLNARDTVQAPPVLKPVKNIFKEMSDHGAVGSRDPRVLERTVMS